MAIQAQTITVNSSAFEQEGLIPERFTCDGEDINPPLTIENLPNNTKSLALIMDDPDAPMGTFVHWLVWNIPSSVTSIDENTVPNGAVLGTNDFNKQDYGGPCPPFGIHRYYFKVYALDTLLDLPSGARKTQLEDAMGGHIIGQGTLMGRYQRSQ